MKGVTVQFNTKPLKPTEGRTLIAIPRRNVRAVIQRAALADFLSKGFRFDPDLKVKDVLILRPPGDGSPDDASTEDSMALRDGESGPTEVCYMVGNKIVCWSPEEEEEDN